MAASGVKRTRVVPATHVNQVRGIVKKSSTALVKQEPQALVPSAQLPQLEEALLAFWRRLESKDSRQAYSADWKRYYAWLQVQEPPINVFESTPASVERYLIHMYDRGLSKATRARALAVLRKTYGVLVRAGLMTVNPAREAENIRVGKEPRTPWLTEDELRAMLRHPIKWESNRQERDWLILATLVGTGLRRREVARLSCEQLLPVPGDRLAAKVVAKGGKEGMIIIPTWLAPRLLAWRQRCKTGPLFFVRRGKAVSESTVTQVVKDAARRATVPLERATPHAIRRSFVTITGQRGVSLEDRQAALLHTNRATTELYDKTTRLTKQAPGDVLEDLLKVKE